MIIHLAGFLKQNLDADRVAAIPQIVYSLYQKQSNFLHTIYFD